MNIQNKHQFFDLSVSYASKKRIFSELSDIVDSSAFIMGPHVANLETNLQEYTGARHCVTCASGTDALILALLAANVGPGDRVITTPFTFAATAEAIAFIGAVPVFVDIDMFTFNMSPLALETSLNNTVDSMHHPKAIVAVDLFGMPAEWDMIHYISKKYEVPTTIADSAQSFGASIRGKKVGTLADITCTSFFPTKPLGCFGDGGAVFTDNDIVASKIRALRVHGSTGQKYNHTFIGMNSRLDTIQAAVLIEQLKSVDHKREQRKKRAEIFDKTLFKNSRRIQKTIPGYNSAHAIFSFISHDRDTLRAELEKAGIPTQIYYPIPLHLQEAYKKYAPADKSVLKNAEYVARSILSLPIGGAQGFGNTLAMAEELDKITFKNYTERLDE